MDNPKASCFRDKAFGYRTIDVSIPDGSMASWDVRVGEAAVRRRGRE
jgi:hypothetical protein